MSAECTGWVYRYSPATRSTFAVHLAIAESVTDQDEYELVISQPYIAAKARVPHEDVAGSVWWLTDHGLLQLIPTPARQASRFRFMMPSNLPAVGLDQ